MGLAAATRPRLSEAEYLALERAAEFRSQFYDGEVFAMAGGTPEHSLISVNLVSELRSRLRGRPCRVYNADLRLKIEAAGLHTYPDASVICGPVITTPGADDVALNPTLIAEVLSPATEAYDRGQKFEFYRRMPSLKEYLLVSQRAARVELFSLDAQGVWRLSEASGLAA
ncbi:MAG: Uma2 family endonuclease, partial [Limisphaerales bacterium]